MQDVGISANSQPGAELVAFVKNRDGDLLIGRGVRASVMGAEHKLPSSKGDENISLRVAGVATVKPGQNGRGCGWSFG